MSKQLPRYYCQQKYSQQTHQSLPLFFHQEGFTLVEMVVVVVILSIFAGMMTLSVGSTEARKNRAFYEHFIDSLEYVRLVSAERMQPMGLVLQGDNQGQAHPVIVKLNNPYAHLDPANSDSEGDTKNSMELSAMNVDSERITPTWEVDEEMRLPELPPDVTIEIADLNAVLTQPNSQALQPWFVGVDVPQALWFGTGEAAPVRIEIRHNKRLVGNAITLLSDGRIVVEQE